MNTAPMAIKPVKIRLLRRLLQAGSDQQVINAIEKIHAADLSLIFAELAENEMKRLIDCLFQLKKAAKVFSEIPEYLLPEILDDVEADKLADIISRAESDDAAYLMSKIPEPRWPDILDKLKPDRRATVEKLLMYPKDTAGAAMSLDFFSVPVESTVEDTIFKLREYPGKDSILYIYVLEAKRLVGVVPLRSLVLSPAETSVKSLMSTNVVTISAAADQEKAAEMVGQYNLLALPVVNDNGEMLGVISVDDVVDIFRDEATEDIYHIAGLSGEDRAFTPVRTKVRRRLPWMLINLCTAFLASAVVSLFEGTIAKFALLAAYMPIVAGMGGNSGTQSLVVITRSIALGELELAKAYSAVLREVGNGFVVGIATGFVTGLVMYAINGNPWLGLIIFLAMTANMVVAGLAGALVPIALKSLKLDPAVASGVVVTTATDVTGFFVFLGLAAVFIDKIAK
jgi:magnesium transporter